MQWLIITTLSVGVIFLLKQLIEAKSKLKQYAPILEIERATVERSRALEQIRKDFEELERNLTQLRAEAQILNDDHDLLSSGFYKPRYGLADSKQYSDRLEKIRDAQKNLIKGKIAITCATEWSVGGSKAEGKKMIDRIVKLGLSAFNVQCDNEIMSVRFDNVDRSEAKLSKIRENIDKLLEPNKCQISEQFFKLKIEELFLAYEYEERLQKEKDEQRLIREQMKEEEKARKEAERAQADAEREEQKYEAALEKARTEVAKSSEADRAGYHAKIAELEAKLKAAHENKERAKSMAEQTRNGFVYVISNIGSFGENVFKIGMTRRLDPMDRVWELSDASVPFDFDVHAIIRTDDAPALEGKLHDLFNARRVNMVNERKEFFKVSIDEVAAACKKVHGSEFQLTLLAEAKEYRQTLGMLSAPSKKAA